MADFVHLHVHSDFSLQDAAVSVMNLADRAEKLGMTHLALTDHGNMFGIMEFMGACKETVIEKPDGDKEHQPRKNPLKPIIGCEVYVAPGSRFDKKGTEKDIKYHHLVLLAANREGYLNLVKLSSFAYTEGFYSKPRVDEELLSLYHGGLIALSACVSGEIPRLISLGKIAEAEKKALYYRNLFGADENGNPNFYLEIQDHGIPAGVLNGNLSQRDIYNEVIAISRRTGIPLVATNDVHYLDRDDYIAHDVLLCIGTAKFRSDEKRTKKYYGDQFYFKTAEEMASLFPGCPDAIENTVRIAQRCVADIPLVATKELPAHLPDCDIPAGFAGANEYLKHLAGEGLARRYPKENEAGGEKWQAVKNRLNYELETIITMGFTGYFLIVRDFIEWARIHSISVGPGRGSGAGSLVAYSLHITDIDPIKYDLLFERFLNPERVSMPDFDIDFANEGRDAVIQYVTEKYGKDRVGKIITFGTLGAKQVIRDVCRTLSISIDEAEMIAKLIPGRPGVTLKKAFDEEPRLRKLEQDPRYTEMFKFARKLEGLNRQSGLHASGIVIGKTELYNMVPLSRDSKSGAIVTQYEMNHLEKCGLVKMDFLGLKTLDVIKRTEELIRRRGGKFSAFDIEAVSEEDGATFKMLGEGQSYEVFQFESDGMRDVLKRAKPGKVEDLIALNALYRPGPMANIPRFIDSKNGLQAITYPDSSLENTLKETYGVIVYQEQVMQVAQIIAGFTLGHADELRRAMGKKIKEKMEKEEGLFLAGAKKQGFSERKAKMIFDTLVPFAGYGFNKSHAAGYAVLAYRTAYLKANFPAEFMAACLTNEMRSADKDKLSECIAEARKMGIAIDPPDINRSETLFTIADGRIVYGLLGIKGIGDASAAEIVNRRFSDDRADGQLSPYRDFMEFLDRINIKIVGKAVIEKLIQTGAFDLLGIRREKLLGNLERAVEFIQNRKEEKQFGQSSLFSASGEKEYSEFVFDEFPEISHQEKLKNEKQLMGFYLSGHPMDHCREIWAKVVKVNLGKLDLESQGSQILMGMVQSVKIVNAKSGKMAYTVLADYNGEIEMTFFPKIWEKLAGKIKDDEMIIARGRIDYQDNRDKYSFVVEDLVDNSDVEAAAANEEAQMRKREKFRTTWLYMADLKSGSIATAEKGSYTIVGQVTALHEARDRKNNSMAFGTLRDLEGDIEMVFFSAPWINCRDLVSRNDFVALRGNIDPENDREQQKPVSFKVTSIADLSALCRSAAKQAAAGKMPKVPATEKRKTLVDAAAAAAAKDIAAAAAATEQISLPEFHIRLDPDAAVHSERIFPLRNYLFGNRGLCPVFIHIGDKIIQADTGLNRSVEDEAADIIKGCAGVLEAWKE